MEKEEKALIINLINQEYQSNLTHYFVKMWACFTVMLIGIYFVIVTELGSITQAGFVSMSVFLFIAMFIMAMLDNSQKKRKKRLKKLNSIPQSTAFETVQEMEEFREFFHG